MATMCGHLEFWNGTILAIFDLQVTPMLPTKSQGNWPLGSGEVKNRFSRWPPWQPSLISHWNNFSYFWSTSHPDAAYQVSSQLAFWFRRRSDSLCWGLTTRQPLWVILCRLPEKGRKVIEEIVEEIKERDREERNRNESEETEEIKIFPIYPYLLQG